MKNVLNDNLRKKMNEAGLSVNALEKKAGLKRSAVQNILHGRSKKPSADILLAIAKVFRCSIRELIDKNSPAISYDPSGVRVSADTEPSYPLSSNVPINIDLYIKAAKMAEKIFKKYSSTYQESDALKYILEIYQYAFNSQHDSIDPYFAEWLFKKDFHLNP
jgi:transcriptional regulator with XRE-family HTH domain